MWSTTQQCPGRHPPPTRGATLRHLQEEAIRRVGLNRARSQASRMARFRTLALLDDRRRIEALI